MPNLVIVSNRLPVSVKKENGKIQVYPSAGGLATGLSSYTSKSRTKWIGWPGLPSDDLTEDDREIIRRKLRRYRCYPLFLTQKQLDRYYNGFSNSVLWPLFHSLPITQKSPEMNWKAYYEVNDLFAKEVLHLSEPSSTIWVHDYQLLLVPEMLRLWRPKDHIGFFLHIPFPEHEPLLAAPHSHALMAGMLGADLLGFHTSAYTENFLEACDELGLSSQNGQINLGQRVLQVTEFPMGIDYRKFAEATKKRAVQAELRRLERRYAGKKVIVTVDRLDPTKGLAERLEAYHAVLESNPELHGKVVMVMLAIPSRTEIEEYIRLRQRVEGLVRDINGTFGSSSWRPVEYMFQTLPFEQLAALYSRADIAFIAPIKDGMNLVAKEYLASQPGQNGVLVLSETAGAAEELKQAVLVNPQRPKTLVDGLNKALAMPARELKRRTASMQQHLKTFTVQNWADTFITSLQTPLPVRGQFTRTLTLSRQSELTRAYSTAARRLIFLDYDGVLRSFVKNPAAAKPSAEIIKLLKHLAADKTNDVVLISGRSKDDMERWFGKLPLAIAAEHGAMFRRKGGKTWHKTTQTKPGWKQKVLRLFEHYAALTPGAFVEQKEWALVWHFRAASPYYAQKHLVAIRRLLKPILRQYDLLQKDGNKILEVHPSDISKGRAAQEWLIHDHDFILCIGDDATDEDMFAILPPQAYSIKVGRGQTLARFRLPDVVAVLHLLAKL